jgi:hypothetical protein
MITSTPAPDRLIRLSRTMMWLTTLGIALIAVLSVLGFAIPDWTRNALLARLGQTGAALPLTPGTQVIAGAIAAVPIAVMLWGLWHARALFAEFSAGRVFTESAARHLQMFGASVLAQAPLGPLTALAFSVGMTLANPPGERMLAIAFSINDYFALIVGGVLFAAASVMREAARIAEENASFV